MRNNHERNKRGTSIWRSRAVDVGRFVPRRMGGGFVFSSLVDFFEKLGFRIHPHGAVGLCALVCPNSACDRARGGHRKRTAHACNRYRAFSLCATPPVSCSSARLHRNFDFIAVSFLLCIIDPHLCLLRLHCRLRREAARSEIWGCLPKI